jgi:hypothetical protein
MTASNSRFLAALLFLSPATAFADPPAQPPTEEQVEAGRAAYREARELHKQGKLKEALDRALEAYRVASTPVTALEVASLFDETGRLVEARDVAREVAAMPVSPRESDKGREARQAASSLAAELDARIPKIAVAGRPAGVEVLLDEKPVPAGAATAWMGVDPGVHSIQVRAQDRTCGSISATLVERETRTIDVEPIARMCPTETPLPAVVLSPQTPSQADTTHTGRWVGLAIGAAGLVAVGAAGVIALNAKASYDSVSSQCNGVYCEGPAVNVRNSARSQADVATVVMAGGAAGAAFGVVLFLLDPGSRHPEAGRPVVGIGPGTIQVALQFR